MYRLVPELTLQSYSIMKGCSVLTRPSLPTRKPSASTMGMLAAGTMRAA